MCRRMFTTHPTTSLIFLDIVCKTARRRYEVQDSKLEELDALFNNTLDDGWILSTNLEKLSGELHSHKPCRTLGQSIHTRPICIRTLPSTKGLPIVRNNP